MYHRCGVHAASGGKSQRRRYDGRQRDRISHGDPVERGRRENSLFVRRLSRDARPGVSRGLYSFDIYTGDKRVPPWINEGKSSSHTGPSPYELLIEPNKGGARSATILINDTPMEIRQTGE